MAPEQLSGTEPSVKGDLYSLGLVLYELFTGKRAFEASSLAELRRLQEHTTPSSPSSLLKEIDPRSEEHTSELQSPCNLVCRLLLEKKKKLVINECQHFISI